MERTRHRFAALTQQWPSYKDQHKTTLESSNKNPVVRDNELLDSVTVDNVFVYLHREKAEEKIVFAAVTVKETTVQKKH